MSWRFENGRIDVDLVTRTITQDGARSGVGGRAFDLLVALLERRDQVVGKEELLRAAWPGLVVEENNLHVQVNALRRVFGPAAIVNVRGRGYRWALAPDATPRERLFGRDALLSELLACLARPDTRLLTLHGSGGVGKTRLADALFAQAPGADDGRWRVELAPLRDASLLADTVLQTLQLQPQSAQAPEQVLTGFLRELDALLLLDNLEHLPTAADLVARLLQAAPGLRIICTSRVSLNLPMELCVLVPPLAVDGPGGEPSPAMELFAQRADEAGVHLADQPAERAAAAELCRRLDGVPLALELAAARLRVLSARELLQRLQLPLADLPALSLVGGGADRPPSRQRSLRDTLDWSVELLSPGPRSLLPPLGVFAGGFTVDAAQAVAEGVDKPTLLDRLATLLDHNLIARQQAADGRVRFTMLEMIREYAAAALVDGRQWVACQDRHAAWFTSQAMAEDAELRGPRRRAAQQRLDAEQANLRAALTHLTRRDAPAIPALRLTAHLTWWWYHGGALLEARRWQDSALALPAPTAASDDAEYRVLRARTLSGASRMCLYLADPARAIAFGTQAVDAARECGDDPTLAYALFHLAIPTQTRSPEQALALHDEARAVFRRIGDAWGEALAIVYGGIPLAYLAGQQAAAQQRLNEGGERFEALGDSWAAGTAGQYLSVLALRRGDLAAAQAHVESSERAALEYRDGYRMAGCRHQRARVAVAAGRFAEAVELYRAAAMVNQQEGRPGYAGLLLRPLARLAAQRGRVRLAARLFGAATVERGPAMIPLFLPEELAACDEARDKLRDQLGGAAYDKLSAEGATWTLHQAIEEAAA